MSTGRADLILHPVRLRIIEAVAGRDLTVRELMDVLGDVPQATLYRHVNRLEAGGILISERRKAAGARGAGEKVYSLPESAAVLSGEDLAGATPEDHMRYFATFASSLLGDYSRYLQRPGIDLEKDGVGYRQHPLHLSDEEFAEFVRALGEAVSPFVSHGPGPGRRRRIFSTVIIPSIEQASPQARAIGETQHGGTENREEHK